MEVKGGVILKKDPDLYEVFDYFRKVLIDELDNADIETVEGQTIKTAVVTAAEKVCSQLSRSNSLAPRGSLLRGPLKWFFPFSNLFFYSCVYHFGKIKNFPEGQALFLCCFQGYFCHFLDDL